MKRKRKSFLIRNHLYDTDIFVCLGGTYVESQRSWSRHLNTPLEYSHEEGKETEAMVISIDDSRRTCMWFKDRRPAPSLIAHEAFHVTFHVLRKSGLRLCKATEEAYSYHLEWLTREIFNRLR